MTNGAGVKRADGMQIETSEHHLLAVCLSVSWSVPAADFMLNLQPRIWHLMLQHLPLHQQTMLRVSPPSPIGSFDSRVVGRNSVESEACQERFPT